MTRHRNQRPMSATAIRPRTPGHVLRRARMHVDGVSRDHQEAAAHDFAGKPWAASLRYLGASSGWHLYEHAPEAG